MSIGSLKSSFIDNLIIESEVLEKMLAGWGVLKELVVFEGGLRKVCKLKIILRELFQKF